MSRMSYPACSMHVMSRVYFYQVIVLIFNVWSVDPELNLEKDLDLELDLDRSMDLDLDITAPT